MHQGLSPPGKNFARSGHKHQLLPAIVVGDEISAQPAPVGPAGEAAQEAAALLLVDRGLDLVTPSAFTPHVLDRVCEVLGRRADSADSSLVEQGSAAMKWR